MRASSIVASLLTAAASTAYADIQIRVFYDNASPVDMPSVSSGGTVYVTVDDHTERVWIRCDNPASEDIGQVVINGTITDPDLDLEILISTGTSMGSTSPGLALDPGCRDWAGITFANADTRATARLSATMYRDLTGPVTIGAIHRLHALRDLDYAVVVKNPDLWSTLDALAVGAIVVGRNVTEYSFIEIEEGSAEYIFIGSPTYAPSTELGAEILALNGAIGTVEVNGDLAAPITCKYGISRLEACAINANITANYDNESNVADPLDGFIGDMAVTGFTEESEGVVTSVIRANDGGLPHP